MAARKHTIENVNALADKLIDYSKHTTIPYLKKFAIENKVPVSSFTDDKAFNTNDVWRKAMEFAKTTLEYNLMIGGLTGKLNCTMCIFALKNVAGWRDAYDLKGEGFETKNIIQVFVPEVYEKRKVLETASGSSNRSV